MSINLNRSIVWLSPLRENTDGIEIIPTAMLEDINSVSNPKVKAQKLWVRHTLNALFMSELGFGLRDANFMKLENGKWICDRAEISLSHSEKMVCAAISPRPIGVDIEDADRKISPETLKSVSKRALNEQEARYFGEISAETFLYVWTRKESAFKQTGKGGFVPQSISCLNNDLRTYLIDEKLWLSLAADASLDIEIKLWDGENARPIANLREVGF